MYYQYNKTSSTEYLPYDDWLLFMHGSTIGGGYGTHSYFGLGENSCLFSGKGTSDIAEFRSGNSGTTI
jgi:hypothetical protein